MSEANKPTPGVWYIEKYSDGSLQIHGNLTDVTSDESEYCVVAECVRSHEDAALIAAAGTVFHETGLTPRHIVEHRDDLFEALELLAEFVEGANIVEADWEWGALEKARAALALVKGGDK